MRKLAALALLILLTLLPAASFAANAPDLSGLTLEELVALRDRIDLAIWNSGEWQEVTVPQGVYEVGVDIPAGHWTVKAVEGASASVIWGTVLDATKKSIDIWASAFYDYARVVSKTYEFYNDKEHMSEIDYDLGAGQYLIIEDAKVVFTPYAGKPDLGFK